MVHDGRNAGQRGAWPRKIGAGRNAVSVYRRRTPGGAFGYMVANYATGKLRFDSYPNPTEALAAAEALSRQLRRGQVLAATLSNEDAAAYSAARRSLDPHGVSLSTAAEVLGECLETVGSLTGVLDAVKFYVARNNRVARKRVAAVVAELLEQKVAQRKSGVYLRDLRDRLARFAHDCCKDTCDVSTADAQRWLDGLNLSPQSCQNYRRVVHLLFSFAVARGYALENPVTRTEKVKVGDRDVLVFTPCEMGKLLAAAQPNFLPVLAMGGFAGLRSAELERLCWEDVRIGARHLVVGASISKTASRRIVPMAENLADWLAPYSGQSGLVWKGGKQTLPSTMRKTAQRAGIQWKHNGLRHSYASYRFAQTMDAGRVSGEMGNSASVVHRHYRELVTPTAAARWFALCPDTEAQNILAPPASQ